MQDRLRIIDEAIVSMRRLWAPTTSGRVARDAEPAVDLSSVLLVHAVGSAEGGLTVAEAAARLGVAAATASRLCSRAVDAGYLERTPFAGDARRRAIALTNEGWRLKQESEDFRHEYLRRALSDWTAADIADFTVLLSRFAEFVATYPPTSMSSPPNSEGVTS